jgi:3D (Asp-Asp-Asp) domain-containing protein
MIKLLTVVSLLTTVAVAEQKVYTVTAYCACKKCCGPSAKGITASGKPAVEGVTIAAPRSIPFGTKLVIDSIGVRVVQDRLAKKFDDRIDVFMADHNKALRFGRKTLTVNR